MQYLVSNTISHKIQLKMIVALSDASSPHKKGILSLKTSSAGAYLWVHYICLICVLRN